MLNLLRNLQDLGTYSLKFIQGFILKWRKKLAKIVGNLKLSKIR